MELRTLGQHLWNTFVPQMSVYSLHLLHSLSIQRHFGLQMPKLLVTSDTHVHSQWLYGF